MRTSEYINSVQDIQRQAMGYIQQLVDQNRQLADQLQIAQNKFREQTCLGIADWTRLIHHSNF